MSGISTLSKLLLQKHGGSQKAALQELRTLQKDAKSLADATEESLAKLVHSNSKRTFSDDTVKSGQEALTDLVKADKFGAQSGVKTITGAPKIDDVNTLSASSADPTRDTLQLGPFRKELLATPEQIKSKELDRQEIEWANRGPKTNIKQDSLAKRIAFPSAVLGTGVGAVGASTLFQPEAKPVAKEEEAAASAEPAATEVKAEPTPPAKALSAVISAPKLSTPKLEKLVLRNPEYADDLYQKALQEIQNKEEAVNQTAKEQRNTRDWARIATTLGNALVKFGAAQQGLRDNVDLSNIQTVEPDWAAMALEDDKERQAAIDALTASRKSASELQTMRNAREQRQVDISNQELTANWRAAEERAAAAAAQEATKAAKEEDRKQDVYLAELRIGAEEKLQNLKGTGNQEAIKKAEERLQALRALYGAEKGAFSGKEKDKAYETAWRVLGPEVMNKIMAKSTGTIPYVSKNQRPDEIQEAINKEMGAVPTSTAENPLVAQAAREWNMTPAQAKAILINRGTIPKE